MNREREIRQRQLARQAKKEEKKQRKLAGHAGDEEDQPETEAEHDQE